VLALLPARRQNLLFSATFPPRCRRWPRPAARPVRVDVPAGRTPVAITQRAIEVDAAKRTPLLRHLIDQRRGWPRVLVFVATRYATEHVADKLRRAGIHAAAFMAT
jgi:ATP-dependent RNA helicase RhlE